MRLLTGFARRAARRLWLAGAQATTRAQVVAAEDRWQAWRCRGRRFSLGTRPVIRWIKGDGLDDPVTRAAIGQATRLFGNRVDYCLCTQGLDASRVRTLLECAVQPVEWWPVSPADNPGLARRLRAAGCPPESFGYWWKWFPERVRPQGPEWILDGDMVITAAPPWFEAWAAGRDPVRVAQDNKEGLHIYGTYGALVDPALKLYSGLVSLPPGRRYMREMAQVLAAQPLRAGHHGANDMCEQGVIAATFQRLRPVPIPLYEFPFARAFEADLDFGLEGDQGRAWGYHFGYAFRRRNPHFERLVDEGVVFSGGPGDLLDRFRWLGGQGPWGIPGWAMPEEMVRTILKHTAAFVGRDVFEIGTSRGRTTAVLASQGCRVTTIDHVDRGAKANLAGLPVEVVTDDAVRFARRSGRTFDLVVCDVHGNSPREWARLGQALMRVVRRGGTMLISNAALHEIPEWREETGVGWFVNQLPPGWTCELDRSVIPGLAILRKPA